VCALTRLLLVPRLWHRSWGRDVGVAMLYLFWGVLCEVPEVSEHAEQVRVSLSLLRAY
jgi:hypothetical protein